jgi:hypothetical protein
MIADMNPQKKTLFIAKTDLNTDGRILSQIDILSKAFPEITIDFILLEDRPTTISLNSKVKLDVVRNTFRHNRFLRIFSFFEFTFKALLKLIRLRPNFVHVHDISVIFPVLVYKWLFNPKIIIYDDHELPGNSGSLFLKSMYSLERKFIRIVNKIITPSPERKNYIVNQLNIAESKIKIFLNLPYLEIGSKKNTTDKVRLNQTEKEALTKLNQAIDNSQKIVLHQGKLSKTRCGDKLASICRKMPADISMAFLGISAQELDHFVSTYNLTNNNLILLGKVNNYNLGRYWSLADATVIMYTTEDLNNRLCSPNRFYLALNASIPIFVNSDNPTLRNLIESYDCGYDIQEIFNGSNNQIPEKPYPSDLLNNIVEEQKAKFIELYRNCFETLEI